MENDLNKETETPNVLNEWEKNWHHKGDFNFLT